MSQNLGFLRQREGDLAALILMVGRSRPVADVGLRMPRPFPTSLDHRADAGGYLLDRERLVRKGRK